LDRAYDVEALFGTDDRRNPTKNGRFSETIDRKNIIINDDYDERSGAHRKYTRIGKVYAINLVLKTGYFRIYERHLYYPNWI